MPRTNLCGNDRKNKIKDLSGFIKNKLYTKNIKCEELAEELNITKQTLYYRLRKGKETGADLFTYGDLLIIAKVTEMTDEEKARLLRL